MPTNIVINSITGTSPFNVFLCDVTETLCVFIDTITSGQLPYTFQVPSILQSAPDFAIRIIDSGNPCTILVNPVPYPILNSFSPLYVNSNNLKIYSFETTGLTTGFYFDPGFTPSAMTRSDDKIWLYDGSSKIYEYDATGSTFPTLIREINTSNYAIDIKGMSPFSGDTILLISESTNNISTIDISHSVAYPPNILYTITGTNQNCNLLRDETFGVTYMKDGVSSVSAYYDDGTLYSTGTWPSGSTLTGLFRDVDTGEIFGITETGSIYSVSQDSGTITFSAYTNLSPVNPVLVGLAQNNNYILSASTAKIYFDGVTTNSLSFSSTSFVWIDWNDVNDTNTSGSTNQLTTYNHTYASATTGYYTINTYNGIKYLGLLDALPSAGVIRTTGYTSELTNLVGLESFTTQTLVDTVGLVSDLPNTLETILVYSNLTGDTSEFPSGLKKVQINNQLGLISGNPINLPSGLTYCALLGNVTMSGVISDLPNDLVYLNLTSNNIDLSGSTNDYPSNLVYLFEITGNNIDGDTTGFTSTLCYIHLINQNTISGDTSGLPRVSATTISAETTPLLNPISIEPTIVINGSNTISGDTSGLPPETSYLDIRGFNTISGDTSGLPQSATTIILGGYNTLSGDTSGLPITANTRILGYNIISGDVKDLPKPVATTSDAFFEPGHFIGGDNTISGDLVGLTANTYIQHLNIIQSDVTALTGNTISGNVSELSAHTSFEQIVIYGANTIFGDISIFPPNLNKLHLRGYNTMSGDVSTIPTTMKDLSIWGLNTITGHISGLTTSAITKFDVRGDNTIFGDFTDFPSSPGITSFILSGGNMSIGANTASGMTFPNGISVFEWYPTGTTPDVTIVDDILVSATGITWGSYPKLQLGGVTPSPSPIGLSAISILTGSPYNLNVITN